MRGLLRWSVAHPVGVSMIALAVAVFGLVSARDLAVDLLPEVEVPWLSITTQYEGVAPREIETLITRPLEQAVSTVEGVDAIYAESSEGVSSVELQFAWGHPLSEALDDVRSALDRVRADLPEQAEPPVIFKFDLASEPIAYLGLTGAGDARQLKYLAEETLSRRLERIAGVASAEVQGGRDREIRVALDSDRLIALGISVGQVVEALERENRTLPAGDMREAGREVVIRTEGEFQSLEDIGEVVVAAREGEPVRVGDLATVVDTIREVRSDAWINGERGLRVEVFKQSGANTVEVTERLLAELDRINGDYRGELRFDVLWSAAEFIEASVRNVELGAVWGALLAFVVLLVFLRDVRATLVIAAAIPLSLLSTFAVMYLRDMSLNVVSLGGLALALGMLVDGAIVILEGMHRSRGEGHAARAAAVEGAHQVSGAVVAGTLTTVAVFVPVVFMGDFAGAIFGELALVVAFALGCSLVVALTLLPMLGGRLLTRAPREAGRVSRWIAASVESLERAYGRLIDVALVAPWAVVAGAAALLLASGLLVPLVGYELLPESDEGRLDVDMDLPVGTPLETTSAITAELERRAREVIAPGELRAIVRTVGPENWWRDGGGHQAELDTILVASDQRTRSTEEIEAAVREAVGTPPGADIRIRQRSSNALLRMAQRGEDRLRVAIRGHGIEAGNRLAATVAARLERVPGVTHARPDREPGRLEQVLRVDRRRAAELGLGSRDIAEAVEAYLLGTVATRFRERGDEFDVRVQLGEGERQRVEQLESLPIVAADGRRVPLGSLVRIEEQQGPSGIRREGQQRVLYVDLGTDERPLSEIAEGVRAQLAGVGVPSGFDVRLEGELAEQEKTFASLLIGILLAVFLVYAVMAIQFESVRLPLVVMVSVPFAFIGAVLALVIGQGTFNIYSFLGAIVLVGIVVNNAIVLVDTAAQLRAHEGMNVHDALVAAGQRRLRPILMTTATTALGLLPLAVATGQGSEMQVPLARVVVGGLLTSTAVTLLLVPCLYRIVEGDSERGQATDATGSVSTQVAE